MDPKTLDVINKLVNMATSENASESESAVRGALGRMKKYGLTFEEYLEAVDPKTVFQYGVVRVADRYVQDRDDLSIPDKRELYSKILSRITERFSGKPSRGPTPDEIVEAILRGIREGEERARKEKEAKAAEAAAKAKAEADAEEAAQTKAEREEAESQSEYARRWHEMSRAERMADIHDTCRRVNYMRALRGKPTPWVVRAYEWFKFRPDYAFGQLSVAFFFGVAVGLPAFFGATFFLKGPDLLLPFYAVAIAAMFWKLRRALV